MFTFNTYTQKQEQRIARLEIALWALIRVVLGGAMWRKDRASEGRAKSPRSGTRFHKRERRKRPAHYIISSLFLRQCYPFLMKDDLEVVSYVSGPQIHRGRLLDQLISFKLAQRELCRARGDIVSSAEALIKMADRGFSLNGTIHSHPGAGETATTPSHDDLVMHHLLEQGGYQAVGIIMTRDGYVYFYTAQMPFTLQVIGKDIIKLRHNSYRLMLNR